MINILLSMILIISSSSSPCLCPSLTLRRPTYSTPMGGNTFDKTCEHESASSIQRPDSRIENPSPQHNRFREIQSIFEVYLRLEVRPDDGASARSHCARDD